MLDRVHPLQPAPRKRRLLMRLGLFAFCGGLLPRPLAAGSGALPFTGAASDLLAVAGAGLLAAGLLAVRATRSDTAGKGGGDW